jgi:hypothetical protein
MRSGQRPNTKDRIRRKEEDAEKVLATSTIPVGLTETELWYR